MKSRINLSSLVVGLLIGICLMFVIGSIEKPTGVGRYQIAFGKIDTVSESVVSQHPICVKIDTVTGKAGCYVEVSKGKYMSSGFFEMPNTVAIREHKELINISK